MAASSSYSSENFWNVLKETQLITDQRQMLQNQLNMMLIEEKISSGVDGFACGEPWNRLKPKVHSLQTFKP